jgi:FkbM family methyltransferase
LIDFLKEGDTFVDIGANLGYYTLLAAALVGEKGSVHTFEPTPRTFKTLEMNAMQHPNIKATNAALMDHDSTISFMDYGPKYSAFNSFENRSANDLNFLRKNGVEITVPAISLDGYIAKNNINPTFIKIDAEGAESIILKGMATTLKNSRPIISIEVAGSDEWQKNCQESIATLQNAGYVFYELTQDGTLFPHVVKENYIYDNLICVPKEKTDRIANLLK